MCLNSAFSSNEIFASSATISSFEVLTNGLISTMANESTFEELQTRISKTIKFMESVPEASFEGAETREVILRFGKQETKFIGADYLSGFATPNFYFHMATVHGILRHNGVEIGKRDFLGSQ